MAHKFALLIGNGIYDQAEKFRLLEKSTADVQALAEALQAPRIGAFDEVQTLIDKPEQTIKLAIERFFQEKKGTDLLLLYLTGHGEIDRRGRWYFVCKETQPALLSSTAISASFIRDVMDGSHSGRQIVILDACYAGAFFTGAKGEADPTRFASTQLSGSGRSILAATSPTELAWEGEKQMPTSIFTRYLVQGLITGAADINNSGWITVDGWFDYTANQMRNETVSQTPRKQIENQQGSIVIARNPFWVAPQTGKAATTNPQLTPTIPNESAGTLSPLLDEIHSPYPMMPAIPANNQDIARIRSISSKPPVPAYLQSPSELRKTNISIIYRDALEMHRRGELAEAISLLQAIHARDSAFQKNEILSLLETDLWLVAEQYALSGKWEEEVSALRALEKLPAYGQKETLLYYRRARSHELLKIAEQNQSYAKVYEDVPHFLQEGNIAAATQSLELIWKNAPYYGDPAKLAIQVGIQAPDRKVIQEKDDKHHFTGYGSRGLGTPPALILWSTFGLLVGLGSFVGILTQSWLWAGSISLLLALALAFLRPYRAVNIIITVCVLLISIALVLGVAWYASTLNYNQPQVSHLWLIGDRTLWLNRQIYLGLASGVLVGSVMVWLIVLEDVADIVLNSWYWLLLLPLILFWIASTYFGWGFGYGFGWLFALGGCLIGCIGAPGFLYSIVIWSKYRRYLTSRKKWTWYR